MLNRHVAHDLGIAEKTLKVHRAQAMKKMGANPLRTSLGLLKS